MRSGWGGEIGGVYSLTAVKSRANAVLAEPHLPSLEPHARVQQLLEASDASSLASGDTIDLINNRLLRLLGHPLHAHLNQPRVSQMATLPHEFVKARLKSFKFSYIKLFTLTFSAFLT